MRSNEKFTQRAELAIEKARRAAGELGHSRVGTEHLLLGILQEKEGLGARILGRRGLEEEVLRRAIVRSEGSGLPCSPRQGMSQHARQAVERSAVEASELRQGYIGTEHLLLGILRQPDCGGVRLMEELGLDSSPGIDEKRSDIIQMVKLRSPEKMQRFCLGIQAGAPVDSFAAPQPAPMPGYDCPIIMAAGAFIQGSSIELSADGPIREPYTIYMQGGLTYETGKLGIMMAVSAMLED